MLRLVFTRFSICHVGNAHTTIKGITRKSNFVINRFHVNHKLTMDKYLIKKRKTDDPETPPKKLKNDEVTDAQKNTGKDEAETETEQYGGSIFPSTSTIKDILSAIPDTDKEAQEYWMKISDFLLNEVVIVANNKKHAIREVEFYWTTSEHNDPFTHKSQIQSTTANWYFHRTGNNYRSGTYKGLDISIGRDDQHVGGILIRSIEALDGSGVFICGPSLSVDRLLECCKAESIPDLVDNQMKGNTSLNFAENQGNISIDKNDTLPSEKFRKKDDETKTFNKVLYLERVKRNCSTLREQQMFCSPRVGLYMTKAGVKLDLQMSYVYRNYRSFTKPKNIPKGRFSMVCAFYLQGKNQDEIARLVGSKAATVSKYIDSLNAGKKKKPESFARKLSDDEVCQAMGALSTLGTKKSDEEPTPEEEEKKTTKGPLKKGRKDDSSEEEAEESEEEEKLKKKAPAKKKAKKVESEDDDE